MIKRFFWNPSNCNYECDKLCDIREYLDYKNCKYRNKLVDKLVEGYSENIDGNEIIYNQALNTIPLNDYKKVCDSCTLYIVLFAVFLVTFLFTFIGIQKRILLIPITVINEDSQTN